MFFGVSDSEVGAEMERQSPSMFDFRQVTRSPKSTVVGLCVLALAAERGVHFDAAGHLAMCTRDWFEVGCGILTAVVSGVSLDARKGSENRDEKSQERDTE